MSILEQMLFLLRNHAEQTGDRELIALVGDISNKAMQQERTLARITAALEGNAADETGPLAARWAGRQDLNEGRSQTEQDGPSRTEQAGQIIVGSMRHRRQSAFSYAEAEQCLADSPDLRAITGYGLWDIEKRGAIRKISRGRYELVL
jgi:hypothetical protein